MEAKRDEWHFVIEMTDESAIVWLYDAKEPLGTVDLAMCEIEIFDKTLEEATAHGVCCCAWKVGHDGV